MPAGRGNLDAYLTWERESTRGSVDLGWRLSDAASLVGSGWLDYQRDSGALGYGASVGARWHW